MQISKPRLWTKDFVIFWFITFFMVLMYFLTITTIPEYTFEKFGASPSMAGLAASIFVFGVIIARVFSGRYLDIIGEKKLLTIGLICSVFVSLLFFPIDNLDLLIVVRFLQGIAMGMALSVLQVSVMNIIPIERQGEGVSYYSLSIIVATAIGPFIGVLTIQFGNMTMIFVVCVLVVTLALLLSLFLSIPKKEITSKQLDDMKSLKFRSFIETSILPTTAMLAVLAICYSGILAFLASYSMEIELITAASYFFIVYSVCVLVSRPFTGRIIDTKGIHIVMFPAFILFAAGLLLLSQAGHSMTLLLAAALAGLGFGNLQTASQTFTLKQVPPERMKLATSTFFICYDIGVGLGPFLLGLLVPLLGFRNLFLTLALVVIACTVTYYFQHLKKSWGLSPTTLKQ